MLHLIRGLPGSGKTIFAKTLDCFHIEADMFFVQNGVYTFNPKRIADAHKWCQSVVCTALSNGMDVAVSNTFTTLWELEPYLEMTHTYDLKVYTCMGRWNSVHNIPIDVWQKMEARWESFEGETFINR